MEDSCKNIFPVFDKIADRDFKERFFQQKAKVIWITGLSGSGKTTLASAIEKELFRLGYFCQLLDGDNIRVGISNNLSFSEEDRTENIRRIAEVAKLFLNCGIITICAFISPTNKIRNMASHIIGQEDFLEIFVDTPIEVCEERDNKGLYQRARKGEIKDFTGISSPFEKPTDPFIKIDTSKRSVEDSIGEIINKILKNIKINCDD